MAAMTPEQKRTASPWSVLEGMYVSAGRNYVIRARGSNIAEVYAQPAAQANAAFIVTACNAHDSMLRALRKIANLTEGSSVSAIALAAIAEAKP